MSLRRRFHAITFPRSVHRRTVEISSRSPFVLVNRISSNIAAVGGVYRVTKSRSRNIYEAVNISRNEDAINRRGKVRGGHNLVKLIAFEKSRRRFARKPSIAVAARFV